MILIDHKQATAACRRWKERLWTPDERVRAFYDGRQRAAQEEA